MTWRSLRGVSVVLVVVFALGACGSASTTRAGSQTVDEIALKLSGSGDDVDSLATQLRAANGGRNTVDDTVAKQLISRSDVIDEIWDATKEASGPACDAWTSGLNDVVVDEVSEVAYVFEARTLLAQIRSDVNQGLVVAQSVTLACELAGLEF
ncbi:hypothetical protein OG801_20950 [Nocardioides sp. NBC_00163]|uniref:hypothetical protein n=1 Tax=Nocardioides sp. NBC_00163 TaxID=2975999 RepID=UPI0032450C2D